MLVSRLRLYDLQTSRLPEIVGVCATDTDAFADLANAAQERLVTCREAGEHGWYGSYGEMLFNVDPDDPYITLPRGVARIIKLVQCDRPQRLRNQFYEYLDYGYGRWPKTSCYDNACDSGPRETFQRNTAVTMADLTVPGYGIRVYSTSTDDVGKRLLFGCADANSLRVSTEDDDRIVDGCFLTIASPFATLQLPGAGTPLEVSELFGIQKDVTAGIVSIYEVNLTDSTTNLLLQMEPGERVASYARYYLNNIPAGCCSSPDDGALVQVRAIVKFDPVPVRYSTDYLMIQSKEAMIAEMQSVRLDSMDSSEAKQQAREKHRDAIRILQGQLVHFNGKENLSVAFAPFGTSRLRNQRIGLMQ